MIKNKIAVSALNLCRPITGVGRYIMDLSNINLSDFEFNAYVPNNNIKINHNFKNIISNNFNNKLGKLFWMLIPKFKENETIVHYPQPLLSPFVFRKKIIITIHDLLFLELQDQYSFMSRISLHFLTWISVKKAHTIICVSEYTKNELLKSFNPKCDVQVVYNPVSVNTNSNEKLKIIESKYLLCVSNRAPRKNLQKTIDGFLSSKYCENGYKLVLCGTNDTNLNLNISKSILDMGYVDDLKLNSLYKNAQALLFFSLGEGFGYPILEAATFNIPVFASNNSSISELFNYQSELLCSDYKTNNGICKFLDKVYSSEKIRSEIQKTLSNTLKKCSFEVFEDKMINIYKKV